MSDQSASVSVSATSNLQIGAFTAAISQPHAVSSHLTKSIVFPFGSLSSSSSLGVFFRLKYCVQGRSTSGTIHGYTSWKSVVSFVIIIYPPAGISTSQNVYVLLELAHTASVIVQFSIFTTPDVGLYISNHSASASFHGVSYSTSFMRRSAAVTVTVLVTWVALFPEASTAS